jgi:hypothetical protein
MEKEINKASIWHINEDEAGALDYQARTTRPAMFLNGTVPSDYSVLVDSTTASTKSSSDSSHASFNECSNECSKESSHNSFNDSFNDSSNYSFDESSKRSSIGCKEE